METLFHAAKTLVPVLAVALAGVAFLGGCRHHGPHGRRGHDPAEIGERVSDHVDQLLRKIDATEEQKAKVLALKDNLLPELAALAKGREAAHKEASDLWAAPTLDASAARAFVDGRLEQLRSAGYKLADAVAELHALLTPEQREKLGRLAERHRCR